MTIEALGLKEPLNFHRDIENDIPTIPANENYYGNLASRVATAALPFLGLYKPISKALAIITSASRGMGCTISLISSIRNGEAGEVCKSLFDTAMSVSSIAGTVFFNPWGILITTAHDISKNGLKIQHAISNNDQDELIKATIQLSNNIFYSMTMIYGGLGFQVGSSIMMVVLSAYSSKKEYQEGHYIECGSHMLMTAIRVNQLRPHLSLLQDKYKIRQNLSKLFLKTASYLTEPLCYFHKIGNIIEPHLHGLTWVQKGHPVLTAVPLKLFPASIRITQAVTLVVALPLAGVGEMFRISGCLLQTEGFCHRRGLASEKMFTKDLEVKVMTFNICGIGAGYEITNGNQVSWDLRIDAIVDQIEKADSDVVCLQEVFDSALGDQLYDRLKDKYAHFYSDIGTWVLCPSGSMVLSKIPGKMSFTSFTSFAGDGKFQNKGFTNFEIYDSISKKLALMIASAHLQHDDGTKEEYENAREGQVKQVNEYFNSILTKFSDVCCVFMGDLNIQKDSDEYNNSSLKKEFNDPREYTNNLDLDYTFSNKAAKNVYNPNIQEEKELLDYILYKGFDPYHVSITKQAFDQDLPDPTKIASDHIPLIGVIQLKENQKENS